MTPEERIGQLELQVSDLRDGLATVCRWLQQDSATLTGLGTGITALIKAHDDPERLAPILGAEQQLNLENAGSDDVSRHYLRTTHDQLSAALLLALLANRSNVTEGLVGLAGELVH